METSSPVSQAGMAQVAVHRSHKPKIGGLNFLSRSHSLDSSVRLERGSHKAEAEGSNPSPVTRKHGTSAPLICGARVCL